MVKDWAFLPAIFIDFNMLNVLHDFVFVVDSVCGTSCLSGQKSFYVKTGSGKDVGPTICYEGKMYEYENNYYFRY